MKFFIKNEVADLITFIENLILLKQFTGAL